MTIHVTTQHGTTIACVGCGAAVPDIDGPTHAYIGASPGCWRIYGAVLEREYAAWRQAPRHRLTVDVYAVQHPGQPSRRSIQSVAVHLISLHLVLERGLEPQQATRRLAAAAERAQEYVWLDPPSFVGASTIVDVAATHSLQAHDRTVQRWAEDVWQVWAPHHDTVRAWADRLA